MDRSHQKQDQRRALQVLVLVSVTSMVPGVVAYIEPGCVEGAAGTSGTYGGGGCPPPTALPPLVFVLALPLPPWLTAAAGTPKLDGNADADADRGFC
jgi:hypothetical protein